MADPQSTAAIEQRAQALYDRALAFDRPTSVFIRPLGRQYRGGRFQ